MKEKAKELVDRFYFEPNFSRYHSKDSEHQKIAAKKCALICVENEMKAKLKLLISVSTKFTELELGKLTMKIQNDYLELKQEIEKL